MKRFLLLLIFNYSFLIFNSLCCAQGHSTFTIHKDTGKIVSINSKGTSVWIRCDTLRFKYIDKGFAKGYKETIRFAAMDSAGYYLFSLNKETLQSMVDKLDSFSAINHNDVLSNDYSSLAISVMTDSSRYTFEFGKYEEEYKENLLNDTALYREKLMIKAVEALLQKCSDIMAKKD